MALEDYADLLESTLKKYLSRNGGLMRLTNELIYNTYEFGEMAAANKMEIDGGTKLTVHALIERNTMARNVGAWDVRTPQQTNHLKSGSVDWSIYEGDWAINEIEMDINAGESQLLKLTEINQEAMITSAHNILEDQYWDALGGMDKQDDEKRPLRGVKAWVTRDGRDVNGTSTVAEIDTAAFPEWLCRFAGPNGHNLVKGNGLASGDDDKLTSGAQLRDYMRRAMRYARFASPNGSKFSTDEKGRAEAIKKQKIYADEIGFSTLERTADALGHGSDHLAPKELDRPECVFKGIPVTFIEHLGLGSGGIPSGAAHADLGGGALTAGEYANTGEVFMLNLKHMKIGALKGNCPNRKKLEFIPVQQVLWQLYRWIWQTICNSRQRQVALWGFSAIQTQ